MRRLGDPETRSPLGSGFNLLDFLQSIHLAFHFLRVAVSPFSRVARMKVMTNEMDKRTIVTNTSHFNLLHA